MSNATLVKYLEFVDPVTQKTEAIEIYRLDNGLLMAIDAKHMLSQQPVYNPFYPNQEIQF